MTPETVSLIGAALALCGSLVGSFLSQRKTAALVVYRLSELEKKVDKHNSVIERTYELEKKTELLDEQRKVANHRIDDLEKENKV